MNLHKAMCIKCAITKYTDTNTNTNTFVVRRFNSVVRRFRVETTQIGEMGIQIQIQLQNTQTQIQICRYKYKYLCCKEVNSGDDTYWGGEGGGRQNNVSAWVNLTQLEHLKIVKSFFL